MKIINQISLTAALLSTGVAGAQSYKIECENYTRTYVTKTQITFNDQADYLSYNFYYEYEHFKFGPEATSGVIQNGGDDVYPIVADVEVFVSKDDIFVDAVSQVVGGRNPHLKTLQLDLLKFGENHYSVGKLLINGVNYAGYVGSCEFVSL
ncbi:hypothetical protein GW915_10905 [bacterium]|nr:hypothetical protein [bacterium]